MANVTKLRCSHQQTTPCQWYPTAFWHLEKDIELSHQTVWHILKKWRLLGNSVALINKQHLANGILRLSDICKKVQNFAGDYTEGMYRNFTCKFIIRRRWTQSSNGVAHTEEMANVRELRCSHQQTTPCQWSF
ncbi:hypothetical protein AVEN_23741-1 [Araneus ventricosus]|uniref:Uncharacterized protein n=1 Tax=Araneus ventricosus TaxID=182803 RepID=A0A4Y2PTY1_ARAVE|nr:hypothetical protein AVEN_23741-1 [Araneus ventricosus]